MGGDQVYSDAMWNKKYCRNLAACAELPWDKRKGRLSAEKKCDITILSGDVHVAAVGVLESDRNDVSPNAAVINQLTSSGIVHPAPPAVMRYFL